MTVFRVSALGFADTLTVSALGFEHNDSFPDAFIDISSVNSTSSINAVSASGNTTVLSGTNSTASAGIIRFGIDLTGLGVNSTASAGKVGAVTPMTNIKVGSTALSNLYVAGTYIERAYVGPKLVYYKLEDQPGQQAYTTPGSYSWTAPAGVTSVCVVCVGGGGGGMYYGVPSAAYKFAMNGGSGGGLAWVNDIPVIPGNSYTVVVGAGGSDGAYSNGSTAGGDSYFISTSICRAEGGNPGRYSTDLNGGGFAVTSLYGTSGGGNGGGVDSRSSSSYGPAGGGGAGGYTGDGGDGRDDYFSSGEDGSGGGGASSAVLGSISSKAALVPSLCQLTRFKPHRLSHIVSSCHMRGVSAPGQPP